MRLAHLTASTFYGGPERQMLGLAEALRPTDEVSFICFAEGGRSAEFLERIRTAGFQGNALDHDTPHFRSTARELTQRLRDDGIEALLCHGYKANLIGRVAARRVGIPAIAVSRGWTAEDRKVRIYEWLDRRHLRFMDHVVSVSDGQAAKVARTGVPATRTSVIRNSARLAAFQAIDPSYQQRLRDFFPGERDIRVIVAAGRLSPEKGYTLFVEAARTIINACPQSRFVLFGEGPERPTIEAAIAEAGLQSSFVLAGFRTDLDAYLPWADVMVSSSYTEGLPNVLLEASAAGVPSVATAVGGCPEVVCDGASGYLVPPGRADAIAAKVIALLNDESARQSFGAAARSWVRTHFTFEAQAAAYRNLLARLVHRPALATA